MSFHILMNRSHYVEGTNRMVYRFPAPIKLENKEFGLVSASIYNSFFNISKNLGNAKSAIKLRFPIYSQANTYVLQDFTLDFEDGFYTIEDINFSIQAFMIKEKLYLVDTETGKNVYFINLVTNETAYGAQFYTFFIPNQSALETKYIVPPDAPNFINPSVSSSSTFVSPVVVINNEFFGRVIGYGVGNVGQDEVVDKTGVYDWVDNLAVSYNSPKVPNINSVHAILLRCNLISNPMISLPNDMLGLIPITSAFGGATQYSANQVIYSSCPTALFHYIEVSFWDEDINPTVLLDRDVTLTLHIKDKN
jgi:hypothetical protein